MSKSEKTKRAIMGDISQRGIDLIKDYESYSSKAYLCPEKVPTIGWGSVRWDASKPVKLGDTCTVDQAEDLLRKEVILIEDAIDSSVKVALTQGQFDCLCSWGYNVGSGWINGKREGGCATLIKYLNKGQYDKVPSELLKFKKGAKSGKSYDGLVNRRKRELRELWFSDHGAQPVAKPAVAPVPVEAVPADPMPQSVGQVTVPVTEVVKHSWTIRGAVAAISGAALQVYNWTLPAATEASMEAVKLKTSLSGWDALFGFLGTNMALLGAMIVVTGAGIVIVRRIQQD